MLVLWLTVTKVYVIDDIQLQGHRQERSAFASSDVSAQPSIHLDKRIHSQALGSMSLNSTGMEIVRSSKRQADNGITNANGSAGNSLHLSSTAKKSRPKNFNDEDDFMVPTFVQARTVSCSNTNLSVTESESLTTSCAENRQKYSSCSSPNASDKPLKIEYSKNGMLRDTENHMGQRCTSASVNKDPKRLPDSGRRLAESPNSAKTSSDQDVDTGTRTVITASGYDNVDVHTDYCSNGAVDGAGCFVGIDVVNKGEDSRVRKESCPEASFSSQIAPSEAKKFNQESEPKSNGLPELEDAGGNEVSGASLPDSMSGMVICPNDVVGIIGPKHFWKARRAIVK